ncbi:methyltransferase domain-containing protein [Xanthomonas campestris pv. campestris]|uniref:class I SAM-dependent methyltransferase n=1 Tax=Xanthomonas campestris TaxID=339 RepID=UPI0025A2FDF7|nr:methyltransferase domain-containing protein [Xanthomonas campestris]MDM7674396.1 methyltransferase domain-containing protein [Xanthomonas campestris pv. campestris]MDM7678819.1 methyltransferase domain-containing protein [Xanthomonas campestris pv. campestris]MDM7699664.1 methyltransferase domain-containing protein [Xanthomonas campestris pv. campestris]MDM7719551.1 methyltransferase domain-containing protein [Xanthomonas campestris pv. campestris]MEB1975521.1 methyltransferase domain-conta
MPGYQTQIHALTFGQHTFSIRALADKQQYADPDQTAADAGISSAQWSLFGQVWPAGQVLAEAMATRPVAGKRILELGCGLGLASLVLRRRGADIVASDHHPLAEVFLAYNAALNALESVPYRRLDWDAGAADMGQFDMIIASDVLYETRHATLLAKLIPDLAKPACEIVISDPGGGNANTLSRMLADIGFSLIAGERQASVHVAKAPRLFVYRRGAEPRQPAG